MQLLIAAISLGFLGSFHCVGMCGPISMALPLNSPSITSKIIGAFIYNFGRLVTYSLLGALFGIVGKGFIIAGYQQTLSIALGILLLLIIFIPNHFLSRFRFTGNIYKISSHLKTHLSQLFRKKSSSSLFLIGILNGLLPCGLVYLGIAGAIATGNSINGSLFMAAFGLGTLPAMLTISLFGSSISLSARRRITKSVPVFVSIMALLLILRGLNLGIPYISPKIGGKTVVEKTCCHK